MHILNSFVQADRQKLNDLAKHLETNTRTLHTKSKAVATMDYVLSISKTIIGILNFYNDGQRSTTMDYLNICENKSLSNSTSRTVNLINLLYDDYPFNLKKDSTLVSLGLYGPELFSLWYDGEVQDCDNIFVNLENRFLYSLNINRDIPDKTIMEYIDDTFRSRNHDYRDTKQYLKCASDEVNVLNETHGVSQVLETAKTIAINLTLSQNTQEAIVYAKQLMHFYYDVVRVGEVNKAYEDKWEEEWCKQIKSKIESDISFMKLSPLWRDLKIKPRYSESAREPLSLNVIRDPYLKLLKTFPKVSQTIFNLQRYQERNITKIQLSEKLSTRQQLKLEDNVLDLVDTLREQVMDYIDWMMSLETELYSNYTNFLNLDMQLLNTGNVFELELVKTAGSLNQTDMQETINRLRYNITHLPDLITLSFRRLVLSLEEIIDEIMRPIENVIAQLQQLRTDLEMFRRSTEMNTDFLMYEFFVLDHSIDYGILYRYIIAENNL